MRAGFTTALVLLGAVAIAGPAASQDSNLVRGYLDDGAAAHTENGHRPLGRETFATLTMEDAQLWPVEVRRGQTYVFYGACDDHCSDLDMDLYDADGKKVDIDIAPDDTPFVQFTAARSGWAHVRFWLASCSEERCEAGVRAMSGGTLVDRSLATVEVPSGNWPEHVRGILDESGQRHLDARFTAIARDDEVVPVELAGEGQRYMFELQSGWTYRFQAACDQDCTDVDIEVLDPSGAQVAENVDFDNNPYVEVRAASSGAYVVRSWLAQCSVEPCYIGVRGYERR